MKQHCREASLESGEELFGTASTHERYLLVESAFPWAHAALETHDVSEFAHVFRASSPVKVLLIGKDSTYSQKGYRVVIDVQKQQGAFHVTEYLVPRGREVEVFPKILEGTAEAYATQEHHRHILVCIDGGHDFCCGRWGQPCYDEVRAAMGEEARVWRCSHIGGHRFAPTAIDFPEGRYYGRIKNPVALFRKELSMEEVMTMYRGNGAYSKEEQDAERAKLLKEGWF